MTFSSDAPTVPVDWHLFSETLAEEIDQIANQDSHLALVGVHLRQFYLYHAANGPLSGEHLVKEAITILQNTFRQKAQVFRIAPDMIAAIVSEVTVPEVLGLTGKNIVIQLANADTGTSIDASTAIVVYPDHGQDAASLVSEVNIGLRRNDRKSISHHIPDGPRLPKYIARQEMRDKLRQAIANHELTLNYQPKIDLNTLKPVSCEALIRWYQEDGSVVRPQDFIPVSEATGEIHRLTELVVQSALREISELPRAFSVAVNISASSLYDTDFIPSVTSALEIWNLPPESFTLEMTETVLMNDPDFSFKQLSRIRDLGVKISIDDFGTGFSSLAYFKAIPADEIKIDQSFVKGMKQNQDDDKIVELIIDLAHKFGLRVVAEGIESRSVLMRLRELGCDIGQGFYLAKPMDLPSLENWLERFAVS